MKPLLTRAAVARVAEHRIREAIAAGELDNLPGLGQPIPGIDDPYDPMWWVKGWLQRVEREHEPDLGGGGPRWGATTS
jgi:hypothetical protein